MFIAKRENGELFSLVSETNRNDLLQLRTRERFFCPSCKEEVVLKLGTKRVYHFAHLKGSDCPAQIEPESEYHLLGKLQLYEWLRLQKVDPKLEPYLDKIKQRPDILFIYQNKTYVIEYQCSPISEQLFHKRTRQYITNGFIPIWILGAKQLNRKSTYLFSLSDFHSFFLTELSNNQWILRSYCPDGQHFITLQQIIPLSKRNVTAQLQTVKQNNMSINELLFPYKNKSSIHHLISDWWQRMQTYKHHYPLNRWAYQDPFVKELYMRGLSFSQLSPALGVPLPSALLIETSPFIWQTYIFLDHFNEKKRGTLIYLQDIFESFSERVYRKQIIVRRHKFFRKSHYYDTIREYIQLLAQVNFLMQLDRDTFKLMGDFTNYDEQAKQFFVVHQTMIIEQFMIVSQ